MTRPASSRGAAAFWTCFPRTSDAPVRIELFGDEIESLRGFDVTSQRSIRKQANVELPRPAKSG